MQFLQRIGNFFTKFKIPTLLGLGVIILGLVSGVVLVLQNQTLTSHASPTQQPQNITLTNTDDTGTSISWQTNSPAEGYITFGQNNPSEQTALDIKDSTSTTPHTDHYVHLGKLSPKTTYQYKIVSGKQILPPQKFTTAASSLSTNSLPPVIGTIVDGDKSAITGIVYLTISGAIVQSSPISTLGSFTIPLAKVYKDDLSDILPLSDNTVATIKIVSGEKQSSGTLVLGIAQKPLAPIKLGETVIFTPPPQPTNTDLNKYDLNGDGFINAADWGIVLQNFGNSPKNKRADITGPKGVPDGVVDHYDLDAMTQKIKETGGITPTPPPGI